MLLSPEMLGTAMPTENPSRIEAMGAPSNERDGLFISLPFAIVKRKAKIPFR
jgi:hypothetical protein